jgi:hypothetical protein
MRAAGVGLIKRKKLQQTYHAISNSDGVGPAISFVVARL